ncbi:hypothetical protein DL96DRAFT_1774291 [Flagelloscypha sp. PMI_526]|nr:hypothetical protein DL96DRAFT_1774291 [Flagelloscypha sp. PMI_526]
MTQSNHDILQYFLDCLTGLELCIFRQVCKPGLRLVDEYTCRRFRVDHVFSPFFTPEQTVALRKTQAKSSVLVSGSAAVQFFECVKYPHSDLDLYADIDAMQALALFIESAGYVFKNAEFQQPSLKSSLTSLINMDRPVNTISYDNPGILDVFAFEKVLSPDGDVLQIQMIVSRGPVMAAIFDFYSTAIMNIITYQNAIALFPVTSFHRYETLVSALETEKVRRGLEKYASRGWKIVRPTGHSELYRHAKLQHDVYRRIGDRRCWTVSLSPVEGVPNKAFDIFCLNSWKVSQARTQEDYPIVDMSFFKFHESPLVPGDHTATEEHGIIWSEVMTRQLRLAGFIFTHLCQ